MIVSLPHRLTITTSRYSLGTISPGCLLLSFDGGEVGLCLRQLASKRVGIGCMHDKLLKWLIASIGERYEVWGSHFLCARLRVAKT
jgi:hypothetical protein